MSLAAAYLAAAGIGGLVGAIEIFQRYRAEPLQALWNLWGGVYVAFNAATAAVAFFVARHANGLTVESDALDLARWAALAGFGAAALLRAKLMSVQLGDGREVALGPEIVIQTFLTVIDRELDRVRARQRFNTVRRLFADVDFERSKLRLPLQVFQAMQTVSEEETEKLMTSIAEVDAMETISPQDKSFLLGFNLLDLVGEKFLEKIFEKHKGEFTVPAEDGSSEPQG